ncbi:hypothetical protein YYG_02329 [Plasmodium vinckei petteri]|uniref:C-mannosyltransferase n=1 Tax=Plasmodium vinckei petteri TaxID=138298 RepID=W7AM82_PLAVN|nr:hypothetical protein YYG_02329 [Plasmodium vinckei petteri]
MKREKRTKKHIKYIRDQIKEIELESKIINKHIKKLEEERKIFQLSTVLLEKYSSFINIKLANNLSIHIFNNTFLNSCGILFTNYPYDEIYYNSSYNNITPYAQCGNSTIKRITSNYVCNENDNIESNKYNNIFRINPKKEKYEAPSSKLDDKINNQTKRTHSCHNIYIKNYKKSKDTLKNNNNVSKIKRETFHSNFKDDTNMLFEERQLNKLNNSYNIIDSKMIESENYMSSDAEINTNINTFNEKNNIKNYNKLKLMQMGIPKENKPYMEQPNSNLKESMNFSSSSNDEYNAYSYIEPQNNLNNIDSYTDIIKNDKILLAYENKNPNEEKSSSTFGGFMSNIKKIFFNDKQNMLSYKNGESDLINELELEKQDTNEKKIKKNPNKTDMSILKFQCVIKSKRIRIYLCVCPNCTKQFYLLIKKFPNKKIISKVFPPSLFSSFVENLRKNNEDFFYQKDKQKWEQISNEENQFNTYHDNISSSFNFPDSNSKFCNCYIGIEEKDNNIFENLDILFFLLYKNKTLFVFITFCKRYQYEFCRNYDEQKVSLYSEESFYFSFYDDLVKSENYLEGINLIINDDRSEYPNRINALQRFNIYPEIILGTIWRLLKLETLFATPYNFYVYAALLSQAASVSTLFFLSVYLGNSYSSGIIFIMLFFSCFREKFIMRLAGFSLRENFASVYMWGIILQIYIILREKKISALNYVPLLLCGFFFLITWQFSVFILLTNIVSLFIVYLLGYEIKKEFENILIVFGLSYILSLVVTLFPRYMLYTYFPYVLISILVTIIYSDIINPEKDIALNDEKLKPIKNKESDKKDKSLINENKISNFNILKKIKFMLKNGFISVFIFLFLRILIINKTKDDSHVLSLLKVRLNIGNHNFDTMIYSGGGEFKPFSKNMLNMIKETALFDYSIIFVIIYSFYIIIYLKSIYRKKDTIKFNEFITSNFVFLLIQTIFFIFLMLIIARLRVLALPLLCVISSLVGSPTFLNNIIFIIASPSFPLVRKLRKATKIIIHIICIYEWIYPFIKYFPKYEYINIIRNEPSNLQNNLDLINWMKINIKEGEPILADIPTSSFLRSTTNFKMILHPQYEDVGLRKRVQDYYMLASCIPFVDAKKYYYEKYKIRYIVSNIYRCASINGGTSAFTLADQIDSNYSRCTNKKNIRFCQKVIYDDTNYKTLYRNGKYSIIKFTSKVVEDNEPYQQIGESKYANISYFMPWISRCIKTDNKCAIHIAEVARTNLDILQNYKIASLLYNYIENKIFNHPKTSDTNDDKLGNEIKWDKDILTIFHLAEFYDYDMKNVNKANILYKKAVDLIIPNDIQYNQDISMTTDHMIDRASTIPLTSQIHILSSYIYFLRDTKIFKSKNELFILYNKIDKLIKVVTFSLDNGYYYENIKSNESDKTEQIIKIIFYKKNLGHILSDLCEHAMHIYSIKHEYTEYESIYKNIWNLVKKVSYLDECVLKNFHILENRKLNRIDYLKFFYIY